MTVTLAQLEEISGTQVTRSASDVKSQWRSIVEQANDVGEVIVTNYNRPEAVVVSVEHYAKLKEQAQANDPLTRLYAQFDQELASLRAPDANSKLREIFDMSPEEIAEAVNSPLPKRRAKRA